MSTTIDFCLVRAADCAREAEESGLDNVRDRWLRAEAAWQTMADRMLKTEEARSRHAAEKAERELFGE